MMKKRATRTHIAFSPRTRNDFIDMIKQKKDVIVVNNDLLILLNEEIDQIVTSYEIAKSEKVTDGWPLYVACPPMLILGILLGACNSWEKAFYDFKKYNIYLGKNPHRERGKQRGLYYAHEPGKNDRIAARLFQKTDAFIFRRAFKLRLPRGAVEIPTRNPVTFRTVENLGVRHVGKHELNLRVKFTLLYRVHNRLHV